MRADRDPLPPSSPGPAAGPVTPRRLVLRITAKLAETGIDSARGDAWLLIAAATGRSKAELIADPEVPRTPEEYLRLDELVRRRIAREPIAYILGEKEFWSLPFQVGPGVLVPRPETETVIEAALAAVADREAPLRVLDLGTGSGCLLLALLSELPHATGLGVDASPEALAIAAANADRLGLARRAQFRRGDWGAGLAGSFELIVSNPPYVAEGEWATLAPEVRAWEPAGALRAGPDGLDAYRTLAPHLARLLAPGGSACVELGQGQAAAVTTIFQREGLVVGAIRRDLAGIERCLSCVHLREICAPSHGA